MRQKSDSGPTSGGSQLLSPLGRQDDQTFNAEINPKQTTFTGFRPDAARDEKLIHRWTAKGDVAGGYVAAAILTNQLAVWIKHLHLSHAVVSNIQVAGRIQTHAVRLIINLP